MNGNRSLTDRVLEESRLLCLKNANINRSDARMTHNQILRLSSTMLRLKTWPQNDVAIPWAMPATQPRVIIHSPTVDLTPQAFSPSH